MAQNPLGAHIESIARKLPGGAGEDFRTFANALVQQVLAVTPGGNFQVAGGPTSQSAAAPAGVVLSVSAANGQVQVQLTNPAGQSGPIWHEVSYAPQAGFTQGVVTLPQTQATSLALSLPGTTYFYRVRSSYDRTTWSSYSSSGAISAGLLSSAAAAEALSLNQTNYGLVTSTAAGGGALVSIQGTGGPLSSLVATKGGKDTVLPAATVVGVTPGSDQFVGWTGSGYVLRPTLAAVLDDGLTPIGKVSVVSTAAPTLPTIVPIISGGGVVGFNVTNGGAGASAPYTLSFATFAPGIGATFGAQTIQAGVLKSVAPGNAGSGYPNGTTVVASGGAGGGASGGGTSAGGNGGRMTAV